MKPMIRYVIKTSKAFQEGINIKCTRAATGYTTGTLGRWFFEFSTRPRHHLEESSKGESRPWYYVYSALRIVTQGLLQMSYSPIKRVAPPIATAKPVKSFCTDIVGGSKLGSEYTAYIIVLS